MRDQMPNAASALATAGIGPRVAVIPLPLTYKQDERNAPAANIEFVGPEGTLGTWLVSPLLGMPQKFDYAGRTWEFALRFKRYYHPFAVTLLKFTHEIYAGTDIPKNFASRIHLKTDDARQDREVLIYMNNPLRHAGLTFYQAGFRQQRQDHDPPGRAQPELGAALRVLHHDGTRAPCSSSSASTSPASIRKRSAK